MDQNVPASSSAPLSVKPGPEHPQPIRNPFFLTLATKRTPNINVRDDFNCFRGKLIDVKSVGKYRT